MKPSAYRIAASCFEPEASHTIRQRREALRTHLADLLKTQNPDLVVLPETVVAYGQETCGGAEAVDGPTVAMISELAAGSRTNVCVPILEQDEGRTYNTAVYVNRTGEVAGIYRKQVPTITELERGVLPGSSDQCPVVLDDLRIGTTICFDLNFPDQIWHWIAAGVDLLISPSYTFAGELMRNWAVNCGVPLVCAFPWESVIFDRDGSVIARAGTVTTTVRHGHHPLWVACTLYLRSRIYHLDGNHERLPELMTRYGADVDVRLMVPDGRMMITTHAGTVDYVQIEREFGLVPLQEYLRASRARANLAAV